MASQPPATRNRGPLTAIKLAEHLGITYWVANACLRRGPFQVAGTAQDGKSRAQT